MMKPALLVIVFCSPFFFPLSVSLGAALAGAIYTPYAPLIAGILLDALSYTRGVHLPFWTLCGVLFAFVSLFVRRFVETSIIR